MGQYIFYRDAILDKEPNLDIHNMHILLQLLVRANLLHHLCLQPLALCWSGGIGVIWLNNDSNQETYYIKVQYTQYSSNT